MPSDEAPSALVVLTFVVVDGPASGISTSAILGKYDVLHCREVHRGSHGNEEPDVFATAVVCSQSSDRTTTGMESSLLCGMESPRYLEVRPEAGGSHVPHRDQAAWVLSGATRRLRPVAVGGSA